MARSEAGYGDPSTQCLSSGPQCWVHKRCVHEACISGKTVLRLIREIGSPVRTQERWIFTSWRNPGLASYPSAHFIPAPSFEFSSWIISFLWLVAGLIKPGMCVCVCFYQIIFHLLWVYPLFPIPCLTSEFFAQQDRMFGMLLLCFPPKWRALMQKCISKMDMTKITTAG